MNKKRFIPLNIKLTCAILLALTATLGIYVFIGWIQSIVVAKYYHSDEAVRANVGSAYASLNAYIAEYNTSGTDTDALQNWLKKNDYTYLEVYDNTAIAFNGGWSYNSTYTDGSSFTATGKNYVYINENASERITHDRFKEDVRNRIIQFSDGEYYVYVDVYKEQHFYNIVFFVKITMCLFVFMSVIVIYNTKIIHKMTRLSREVQAVTDGDLDAEIDPTSNDEIGRLAVNVDTMRNAIVEKLQSEKIAWDANTQLITAMSHDIRTPLTSLIGYLDIIESGKSRSRGEELRYIASCREKAFQLKEMSDKLFQYFLVFGSQEGREKNYEVFDAGILIQQLISEHSAELISYGYDIDFEYEVANINIMADIQGLRRLFDNIFSNITKYADKSYHIRISAGVEDDRIIIRLINSVLADSRKVESNKIGLKTCERICSDMGGSFSYHDEGQLFTARITFPVYHGLEKPANEEVYLTAAPGGMNTSDGNDGSANLHPYDHEQDEAVPGTGEASSLPHY